MSTKLKVKDDKDIPRKAYYIALREAHWLWIDIALMFLGTFVAHNWLLVLWTTGFAGYELWHVQRKADEIVKIVTPKEGTK